MSDSGNSRMVAIVVALSNRSQLTPSEEISLKHLRHFLGRYDKYVIAPTGLDIDFPDFGIKRFDERFFGSIENHIRMLFSPGYYNAFSEYKYILTYHLDALVFADELEEWCKLDYDFIGPPWVVHEDAPYTDMFAGKVGNSGFCLKKVSAFQKILNSREFAMSPDEYWQTYHAHKGLLQRIGNYPKKLLMRSRRFNNIRWEMNRWSESEDCFIANRVLHYYPEFNVAPLEVALRFGFECVPGHCFELNGRKLPFGCHAWERYDRGFWEPYLLD